MKVFYSFLFLGIVASVFGQDGSAKKAFKLFANKNYLESAEEYRNLAETPQNLAQLAACYFFCNQNVDAIKAYEKLFETFKDSVPRASYFKASQAYMKVGDYDRSDPLMTKYLNKVVLSNDFIYNLKSLLPYLYDIQLMTKSNANPNYGMVSFGDQIVYAAAKNEVVSSGAMTNPSQYDLMVASVNKAGLIFQSEIFSKELNSKFHESSPSFSTNGKTIYFNRTLQKDINIESEKYANKMIYKADYLNDLWTEGKTLPFCKKEFSYENPMISKDGRMLFFSSNCKESIGGYDIFYVKIYEDGSFGDIKRVAGQVNTIHDERSPFLSEDNATLYFSSNGHQGMGGLDIFSSEFLGLAYQNVLNLGSSINSNLDDFCFTIDAVFDQGFLTSNREGQNNLYSFKRVKNEMNFTIQGSILDKNTNEEIPNAKVTLIDEKGKVIPQFESSSTTEFLFKVKPSSSYSIKVESEDFYPFETDIFTTNEKKVRYQIELFRKID